MGNTAGVRSVFFVLWRTYGLHANLHLALGKEGCFAQRVEMSVEVVCTISLFRFMEFTQMQTRLNPEPDCIQS
jgi:hypothetical protein